MPRTARTISGGCCYHLINRGNNRSRVFHEQADYAAFLSLFDDARKRVELPIFAACLMPNHVHFVVQPRLDADLARWTHWLFTTHVNHYHRKYQTSGRLWQGRFKAFVIQQDHHLLTVLRYVERNALRASLVARAEHWRWGSLDWRVNGRSTQLDEPPVSLPSNWVDHVNAPESVTEVEAIRTCVNRQRPFGSHAWVAKTAQDFGLTQSVTPVGRPPRK